jgi:hypothetical protein
VNRRLIDLLVALAAIPPGCACGVYGWRLVSFAGFAVRIGEDIAPETWGQIGLVAGQMIVIAAALLIVWQGAAAQNWRKAGIALAVAWLATAPLLILMLRPF